VLAGRNTTRRIGGWFASGKPARDHAVFRQLNGLYYNSGKVFDIEACSDYLGL
jgi:hypothetical protein